MITYSELLDSIPKSYCISKYKTEDVNYYYQCECAGLYPSYREMIYVFYNEYEEYEARKLVMSCISVEFRGEHDRLKIYMDMEPILSRLAKI